MDQLKNRFRINGGHEYLCELSDTHTRILHFFKWHDLHISLFGVLFFVSPLEMFALINPDCFRLQNLTGFTHVKHLAESLRLGFNQAHRLTWECCKEACWANECRDRSAMVLTFSVTNSHHLKGGKGGMTDEDLQKADSEHEQSCKGAIKNVLVTAHRGLSGARESNRFQKRAASTLVLAACQVAFAYLWS